MVNKRGWIRIVEALIAVLMILGAIIFIIDTNNKKNYSEKENYINDLQKNVLDEISNNLELRNFALSKNESEIKKRISGYFPDFYEFDVRVCNLTEDYCLLQIYPNKNIYVADKIISGTLEVYSPVKVRIFLWEKK